MIRERPVTEYLSLNVERPAPGVFRLDVSELGGPDTLGAGTGTHWEDILPLLTGTMEIRRGARADPLSPVLEAGTLSATVLDADPDLIRPGQAIRLEGPEVGTQYTGKITTSVLREAPDDLGRWHTYTTFTAVDAVADIANTPRSGAIPENGQGAEQFSTRVSRLLRSLPSWIEVGYRNNEWYILPTVSEYPLNGGTTAQMQAEAARWTVVNGTLSVGDGLTAPFLWFKFAPGGYATRTLTGLIPGRLYELDLLHWGMPGPHRFGVNTLKPQHVGSWSGGLYFVADDTTATLCLAVGPETDDLISAIRLRSWGAMPTQLLTATVYESTLASHLDKTVATVGGRWWVDVENRVNVVYSRNPQPIAFTDEPSSSALHYVDIVRGQSTADIVTDVDVVSLRRGFDPQTGANQSDDRTYRFSDPTLSATWGGRGAALETFAASRDDAYWIARGVIDRLGTPSMRVESIRWNAQEDIGRLAMLDVYAKATVTRQGTTSTLDVATITHHISPRRHMVTLDLIP